MLSIASARPAAADAPREADVTSLLLAWQSTGDRTAFAALAAAVTPEIESAATALLRRRGRVDQAVVGDVVSLVLDHLRRLHDAGPEERRVSPFRPAPGAGPAAGTIYLRWLTRSRAADLLRTQRRRDRREPSFTHRFGGLAERADLAAGPLADDAGHRPAADGETFGIAAAVAERLDGLDRAVAELLLRGEPQVEIARRLGVSEGTVTRRRQRLTARLGHHARTAGAHTGDRLPAALTAAEPAIVSFTVTLSADSPAEFPLPRHVHTLSLLVRGRGAHVVIRGAERHTIDRRPGSLALVTAAGEPGAVQAATDEPLEAVFVVIPPEVVAAECGGIAAPRLRDELDFRDGCLEQLLAGLGGGAVAGPAAAAASAGILRRLLAVQGVPGRDDGEAASRLVPEERRQLVAWIDAHLDRPLPLPQLAGLFGLSVGHFARKVRNTFRLCPSRLVQQRRAIAAMGLLADHDAPLSLLAARLGFASQSHFTTMFRRHVGLTPAVFRQRVHGRPGLEIARGIPAVAAGRAQDGDAAGVSLMRGDPAGSTDGWHG